MLSSKIERRSITVPIINRSHNSYQDIIVPLVTHVNAHSVNAYTFSFAKLFGASVTGVAFAFDPIMPVTGPFDTIPADIIDDLVARAENEARENSGGFERLGEMAGADVHTKLVRAGRFEAEARFAAMARNFDLSIVPQEHSEDANLPNFAVAALFDSGRPAIVVPYIHHAAASLDRILVCWDGSRAAARAISDSWPLLERAGRVDVVTVIGAGGDTFGQQELGEHFAKHSVNARLQTLTANDIDVGNAILSHAADIGSTLIIMGGYGHSRARELILGGATRTILKTMTVPVLISH